MGLTSSVTHSLKACWLAQPPLRCSLTKKTPSQTRLRRLQLTCVLTLRPVSRLCVPALPLLVGHSCRWDGVDEVLDAVQARGDPCPGARPQGMEA